MEFLFRRYEGGILRRYQTIAAQEFWAKDYTRYRFWTIMEKCIFFIWTIEILVFMRVVAMAPIFG